jgi:hypothetical protein
MRIQSFLFLHWNFLLTATLFRWKLTDSVLSFSVLSTSSSIFSPRCKTCSIFVPRNHLRIHSKILIWFHTFWIYLNCRERYLSLYLFQYAEPELCQHSDLCYKIPFAVAKYDKSSHWKHLSIVFMREETSSNSCCGWLILLKKL